jgi:hypothetical protein
MNLIVLDNVLTDPISYVRDALSYGFEEVFDADKVFKGIQPRSDDEFQHFIENYLSLQYETVYNFIRQSPEGQDEPNFVHTDDGMGDIIALLYLNENHPEDGTIIYDNDGEKMCSVHMKFNRAVIFGTRYPHSRALFENFGEGDDSRLIQVLFLKLRKDGPETVA